ncbi:MAG: ABC transporter permease [Rhodobacteraceae bacterium]|nr:ABC transporter permease [Paracoccaceae bacterium]
MAPLDRKLLRDLRRLWAQSLAIALVLGAGVAILVIAFGAQVSLFETRTAYYERNRFADVFAAAKRAPLGIVDEIAAIPGVQSVEARVAGAAILDVPGLSEPATGRILSLPAFGEPALNVPLLRSGRLPDPARPDEVAVNAAFAAAHGFQPGDGFGAVLNGRRRDLIIVGTLLSPEFIYTVGPGGLMPDDRRFGVIWMGHDAAAAAFGEQGAFNDLALGLVRGASEDAVIARLDDLLAPYGGTGAYGRDQQISHRFLDDELRGLRAMAWVMPPVFFLVAAFLVNLVLARMIALERSQIGLLKAIGYSGAAVARHYLKLAAAIGAIGIAIGWGFGWWAGQGMTRLYSEFFRFPYLVYVASFHTFAVSALVALVAVLSGAFFAVRAALRLAPAVAMAPPMPVRFRRRASDRLGDLLGLPTTARMILRSLTRWPGRAAFALFGVAASVAILVGSLFTFDAIEYLIDESLFRANRQDATVTFNESRTPAAVLEVAAFPGVLAAEGGLSVPVTLRHGPLERRVGLEGRPEAANLARLLDAEGRVVAVPEQGLLVSDRLAGQLDLEPGDTVEIDFRDGRRETRAVPLAGTVRLHYGEGAYMAQSALSALRMSGPEVNLVHVRVDMAALPALNAQVKMTPEIAGMTLWTEVRATFRATMAENLSISITVYSILGALIAVGVVYNAARIQLSERAHELASLRILGFTRGEVSFVLFGELLGLALLAMPLGCVLGYSFAALIVQGFSTDTLTIPLVVRPATYGYAVLIVAGATLASALLVRRRIDRLDLVAVMKTRE